MLITPYSLFYFAPPPPPLMLMPHFFTPIDTPHYATPPIAFAAFHYYWLRH
jgi:hypothetical protein